MSDITARKRLEQVLQEIRSCYHDAIANEIQNSHKSYSLIAEQCGVSEQTVYTIARERAISRNSPHRKAHNNLAESESNSHDGGSENER